MWRWVAELLTSLGFGVLAAILPVFNNEAFVAGSQWLGVGGLVPVVVGLGIGNGIGKTIVLLLVRAGKQLPWSHRPRVVADAEAPAPRHPRLSAAWRRWRGWMAALSRLVSDARWGVPLVTLSAATSIPPVYPTTVVAATTRMRAAWFFLAVAFGSCVRMALVALAARGLLPR